MRHGRDRRRFRAAASASRNGSSAATAAARRATNLRSPGAAPRAMRPAPVRAGALHAPDIVPVTAADAARFAASARRRRCMATSGSTCAPRATRTAARCGASSFRPAQPGGSMSPSATRPASRCAAAAATAAHPTPVVRRCGVTRRAADRRRRRVARRFVAHHRPRDGRARRHSRARRPRTDGTAPSRWRGRVAPESRLLGRRRRFRRAGRRRARPFPPRSPAACGDGGASPRAGSLRRRVRRRRAVGALIRAAPHGRRLSPMSPPPPRAMLRA